MKLTDRQLGALVALDDASMGGATAGGVASRMRVSGVRRGGNSAVKGSWSGVTSPSMVIAPTLTALVRRGLVSTYWNSYACGGYGHREYSITDDGRRGVRQHAVRVAARERADEWGPWRGEAHQGGGWLIFELGEVRQIRFREMYERWRP